MINKWKTVHQPWYNANISNQSLNLNKKKVIH